jgi:hypothetical protein
MSHRSIVLLLALVGCSRPPHPFVEGQAAAGATDTAAEGTVRVSGPAESAEVILQGATASVGLTGPLVGELRRLSGATLRVSGTPRGNATAMPPRAVTVRDYQILEVDGQRPLVGIVLSRNGRLWLAAQDTIELVGVTPDSAARPGAKVFVLGVRENGRLLVKAFGVIRAPD